MNVRHDTGEIYQVAIENNLDASHKARSVIETPVSLIEAPLENDTLKNDIEE